MVRASPSYQSNAARVARLSRAVSLRAGRAMVGGKRRRPCRCRPGHATSVARVERRGQACPAAAA
eukprot:scaffold128331_cov69-Phaeocystis_antarctica.AAC.3